MTGRNAADHSATEQPRLVLARPIPATRGGNPTDSHARRPASYFSSATIWSSVVRGAVEIR